MHQLKAFGLFWKKVLKYINFNWTVVKIMLVLKLYLHLYGPQCFHFSKLKYQERPFWELLTYFTAVLNTQIVNKFFCGVDYEIYLIYISTKSSKYVSFYIFSTIFYRLLLFGNYGKDKSIQDL